jgi:uncharacterized membrane protein
MEGLLFGLSFAAALGSGLMAGLFFVFSVTVMAALAKLSPPSGIAAMQSINATIVGPLFLTVFMGTAVLCAVLAIAAWMRWPAPGAGWLLAGAGCYLFGALLVTMAFNVPLNDALAAAAPDSAEAAPLWQRYLSVWTRWNHLRTAACTAAMASFILAIRAG